MAVIEYRHLLLEAIESFWAVKRVGDAYSFKVSVNHVTNKVIVMNGMWLNGTWLNYQLLSIRGLTSWEKAMVLRRTRPGWKPGGSRQEPQKLQQLNIFEGEGHA